MKYLIISLLCLLAFVSPAAAASTQTDTAEADYRFQFDRYREAHRQYQVAKANFFEANTHDCFVL